MDPTDKAILTLVTHTLPGASLVKEFVEHFFPDPNDKWRGVAQQQVDEILAELQRRLDRLDEELKKHGRKLDELDAFKLRRLIVEALKVEVEDGGGAKQDAVLNAIVRQFDPREPVDTRKYWLDRLLKLDNHEVSVLREISGSYAVTIAQGEKQMRFHEGSRKVEMEEGRVALFADVCAALAEKKLLQSYAENIEQYPGTTYRLNTRGRAIAALFAPVASSTP